MLARTAAFAAAAEAAGIQPVWVLDFPEQRLFVASRAVTLDGQAYDPALLARFDQGGLSQLSMALDASDQARVNQGDVRLSNLGDVHRTIGLRSIDNAPVTIRLTFQGLGDADPLPVFTGRVDDWSYTEDTLELRLVDGSLSVHRALPALSLAGWPSNPVDVIQQLIASYLPRASVDAASFAAARAARSDWRFGGSIDQGTATRTFLPHLARCCGCWLFENATGAFALVPQDAGGTPGLALTEATVAQQPFRVARAALDRVYTDIRVAWARTGSDQSSAASYGAVAWATPGGTTHRTLPLALLCGQAQRTYNLEQRVLEVLAPTIVDRTTAELLLTHLVLWHTRRAHEVTVQSWTEAAHLELGDLVTLTHRALPDALQGGRLFVVGRQVAPPHAVTLVGREARVATWAHWTEPWEVVLATTRVVHWVEPWEPLPTVSEYWELFDPGTATLAVAEDWEDFDGGTATLQVSEDWEEFASGTATLRVAEYWEV